MGLFRIKQIQKDLFQEKIFCDGNYQMKSITDLTEGNSWPTHSRNNNLFDAIKNLLVNKFTVYQFDTAKELFTWLAE